MQFKTAVLNFLLRCMQILVAPFFWIRARLPTKKLPPPTSKLLEYSASQLAVKIRQRELASYDVIRAYIERIQQVNPQLNAVVEDRFEQALVEAKRADEEIAACSSVEKLALEKPLLGVPLTVKESCSVEGMKYTVGSLPRKNIRAANDGGAVANLRRAGVIILAVTNTPEYCMCCETYNSVTGRTNNPYDLRRSSAGSSGGEGALLGCGASCVGVGSDIAGSIRIPAMWCGIFGHKPSAGIIPLTGHFPLSKDPDFANYLTIGPIVRYAEDLTPMMYVMSGDNAPALRLYEKVDLAKVTVYLMKDCGAKKLTLPVQSEIGIAIDSAANYLKNVCSKVEEVRFTEMKYSLLYSLVLILGTSQIPNVLQDDNDPKKSKNVFWETIKFIFRLSKYSGPGLAFSWLARCSTSIITPSMLETNKIRVAELKKKITSTLGEDGVLLYPNFPTSAVLHYESYAKLIGAIYTVIFNILGLPSSSVPMGRDSKGMPIGIQIVGAPNQDRLCIAIAQELEKGFGGWVPPTYSI
ncbi:fatty-acid amide hydrolase 2-A-like [Ctenocephalides felis]|uniref:fatty-acid amide hydrolase 2-A-like n=1 Tax=Ctenocephalides felis TaxID=7515 RepID=UPI000E6E2AD3|nr:fatty-acid amide hydrolase 2-A-like [Ctenocephalides felis]